MKKKFISILLVLVIGVGTLFAATASGSHSSKLPSSRLGLGVAVGFPSLDPILTYTYSEPDNPFGFRLAASAGISLYSGLGMHASLGGDWIFYKLEFTDTGSPEAENSVLDFSLGGSLSFTSWKGFDSTYIAPAGVFTITYTFAKNWTVFTRESFGYSIALAKNSSSYFYYNFTVGFTYEFNLDNNKRK